MYQTSGDWLFDVGLRLDEGRQQRARVARHPVSEPVG